VATSSQGLSQRRKERRPECAVSGGLFVSKSSILHDSISQDGQAGGTGLLNGFSILHVLAWCRGASEWGTRRTRVGRRSSRGFAQRRKDAEKGDPSARYRAGFSSASLRFCMIRYPRMDKPATRSWSTVFRFCTFWLGAAALRGGQHGGTKDTENEGHADSRCSSLMALTGTKSLLCRRHLDRGAIGTTQRRTANGVAQRFFDFARFGLASLGRVGDCCNILMDVCVRIYSSRHRLTIADRAAKFGRKSGSWRKVGSQVGAGAGDKISAPNSRLCENRENLLWPVGAPGL
jgi:hypothetical protein